MSSASMVDFCRLCRPSVTCFKSPQIVCRTIIRFSDEAEAFHAHGQRVSTPWPLSNGQALISHRLSELVQTCWSRNSPDQRTWRPRRSAGRHKCSISYIDHHRIRLYRKCKLRQRSMRLAAADDGLSVRGALKSHGGVAASQGHAPQSQHEKALRPRRCSCGTLLLGAEWASSKK